MAHAFYLREHLGVSEQVTIRLPQELLARVDRLVEQENRRSTLATATRSDVIRHLLRRGLDQLESKESSRK